MQWTLQEIYPYNIGKYWLHVQDFDTGVHYKW